MVVFNLIIRHQKMVKEVITITFGDAAENSQGMEIIGQRQQKGFSYENLLHAKNYFQEKGATTELIELHHLIPQDELPKDMQCEPAYILLVKQGLLFILPEGKDMWSLHKQLRLFQWDSKYFDTRRQRVLNKLARSNVCFSQTAQSPDYAHKKGTIIPWTSVPLLSHIHSLLNPIMGTSIQYYGQGNLYHDGGIKTTGLGYHGDAERKMVLAVRTGNNVMPLHYQWFFKSKKIGKNFRLNVRPGDLYVMSQKAVGTDWLKKNRLTIRHASGAQKFVKI